jgi:hypothetical protein
MMCKVTDGGFVDREVGFPVLLQGTHEGITEQDLLGEDFGVLARILVPGEPGNDTVNVWLGRIGIGTDQVWGLGFLLL